MNLLKNAHWQITGPYETPFANKYDIYQDGTTPLCRSGDGKLWGISGHTHAGHIGMFCGTRLDDLKECYPIKTNFSTGGAGTAFDCIRYPEGVLPRGSIWPFGLYICPVTNRFFAWFHNETGWNGQGTGYTVFGLGNGEPDFRHIGLMHSDDCGKTWDFDRWVVTSQDVCFSDLYRPDNLQFGGQNANAPKLGAGDFSIFVHPDGEYIYLFYNILTVNSKEKFKKNDVTDCDVFVARTRQRKDGYMGDFVKYYEGSFCEAGNMGKESAIVKGLWHPRVIYSKSIHSYIMSGQLIEPYTDKVFTNKLALRTSTDLINWSEPVIVGKDLLSSHYFACLSNENGAPHNVIVNKCSIMCCNNGTDVMRYDAEFTL